VQSAIFIDTVRQQ